MVRCYVFFPLGRQATVDLGFVFLIWWICCPKHINHRFACVCCSVSLPCLFWGTGDFSQQQRQTGSTRVLRLSTPSPQDQDTERSARGHSMTSYHVLHNSCEAPCNSLISLITTTAVLRFPTFPPHTSRKIFDFLLHKPTFRF